MHEAQPTTDQLQNEQELFSYIVPDTHTLTPTPKGAAKNDAFLEIAFKEFIEYRECL